MEEFIGCTASAGPKACSPSYRDHKSVARCPPELDSEIHTSFTPHVCPICAPNPFNGFLGKSILGGRLHSWLLRCNAQSCSPPQFVGRPQVKGSLGGHMPQAGVRVTG